MATGFYDSQFQADPIYPAVYGSVVDIGDALEEFDTCLTSIEGSGGYHHYHIISPCIYDAIL